MSIVAIAGALLNAVIGHVCTALFKFPIFLDTIFIIAITFTFGLLWGSICAALTAVFIYIINLISKSIIAAVPFFLDIPGFASIALVTWLFMRIFARELNFKKGAWEPLPIWNKSSKTSILIDKIFILFILSFALCVIFSFLNTTFYVLFTTSFLNGIFLSKLFSCIINRSFDMLVCIYASLFISYSLRSVFNVSSQSP